MDREELLNLFESIAKYLEPFTKLEKEEQDKISGLGILQSFSENVTDWNDTYLKAFDEFGKLNPEYADKYQQICEKLKGNYNDVLAAIGRGKEGIVKYDDNIQKAFDDAEKAVSGLVPITNPYSEKQYAKEDWKLDDKAKEARSKLIQLWQDQLNKDGVPDVSPFGEDAYSVRFLQSMKLCGDVEDLASFYITQNITQSKIMTETEKRYVKSLAQSVMFYNELEKDTKQYKPKAVFELQSDPEKNSYSLTGYNDSYQYQNTENGCWSCAYSMLLKSRGISLDQRLIRSFRPNRHFAQNKNTKDLSAPGLTFDSVFKPSDLGDLTAKLLPNTAIHTATIPLAGVPWQQKQAYAGPMKQIITDALCNHKSPIAMVYGGHYITVVGIEGDNLKILDSLDRVNPNRESLLPVSKVLASDGVSLSWLHDLQVENGKIAPVPPFNDEIKYAGGELLNGVAESINCDGLIVNAEDYSFGFELPVQHDIYLPKKLTDPALLTEKTQKSLMDKDFVIDTAMQKAYKEDLKALQDAAAEEKRQKLALAGLEGDALKNKKNDILKEGFSPKIVRSRALALAIVHKCLADDYKYVLEDKRVIQRTLSRDFEIAKSIMESKEFKEIVTAIDADENSPLRKDPLDVKDLNAVYDQYKAKAGAPYQAINKAMAKDVKPQNIFDNLGFSRELKDIERQVGLAEKKFQKLPKNAKRFDAIKECIGKLKQSFEHNNGDMEMGLKRFNRKLVDFNITFSKIRNEKHWTAKAKNKKMPTESEIQELKLMHRIANATRFASLKLKPEEIEKQKLCEKIITISACELMKNADSDLAQRGLDIMCNINAHNEEFNKIMDSQSFKDFVKGKSLKALSKLVKEDNAKLYKAFIKSQRQPAADRKNVSVNDNPQQSKTTQQEKTTSGQVKTETPLAK